MKSWPWNEFILLLCYQRASIHLSCSPALERKHPMKYMPESTRYISLHFLIISPLLMTSAPFLSNPLCSDTPTAQTWLPISYRNKLCSVTMDIVYPVRKTHKTTVHCEKNENAPVPIQWPHPHWHQSSNFSYLRKHDHIGDDYALEYCSHIQQCLSFSSSVITVLKDRSDRILLTQIFYRSS